MPGKNPAAELGRPTSRAGHHLNMFARLRNRFEISPHRYAQVTVLALIGLALIVLSGAAVRLTESGLGCPDWPKCYGGGQHPALDSHAIIEMSNRIVTGLLGIVVIAAAVLSFFRRPYRPHLAIFGALLPLGVVAQAILGALVVKYDLRPELVMGHFILSMALLDAGFALMWCSRYEPWDRRRSSDRKGVWAVRALVPLGQLTILAGTIATGSGPHAGEFEGQLVQRFTFEGIGTTLEWVVQRHAVLATIYGLAAIGVWFYLRRPCGDRRALKPLTLVLALLAVQGIVGYAQWELELPTEIVWVHVALATCNWLAMLWTIAAAGRLEPRGGTLPTSARRGAGSVGPAATPTGAGAGADAGANTGAA
jgi:cytochrome c oxidase assembly protein subunit 15